MLLSTSFTLRILFLSGQVDNWKFVSKFLLRNYYYMDNLTLMQAISKPIHNQELLYHERDIWIRVTFDALSISSYGCEIIGPFQLYI